jgi:hypothetical protein
LLQTEAQQLKGKSQATNTDETMFLEFIISFLELLEKHVEDGSLNKQLKKADQGGS